jgi:indolepyruvate ferredoxin oxidoreductase alpha subunit
MGERILLMGNEAIARGALEAGVSFCAGYPGNPSSEIIDTLLKHKTLWPDTAWPTHVEWSVNEIVAMEAAAAAAFTGLRALVAMKQNGINVCADFLTTVNLTGLAGGALVVVVCDDPGPLTSSNEEDSRYYARLAMLPLLEPSTAQEAKDATAYALDLSESSGLPVIVRSVSRLSHGRGPVSLGVPSPPSRTPRFDPATRLLGLPHVVTRNHERLLGLQEELRLEMEASPLNAFVANAAEVAGGVGVATTADAVLAEKSTRLVVVAAGLGALYADEAVKEIGRLHPEATTGLGVLKLSAVWPFPRNLVAGHLAGAEAVLVVEQVEPFVEEQVLMLLGDAEAGLPPLKVYGKASGHMPAAGEIDSHDVLVALRRILALSEGNVSAKGSFLSAESGSGAVDTHAEADALRRTQVLEGLPPRDISFCFGCPHRASFYAIKAAMALDGREGVVTGDIGCYGLAAGPTGFSQLATLHCMGAGLGEASGLGVLGQLGFTQPVVAVAGDSTFFHACLPALVNARWQKADVVFVILDNSTTAMTGFQPHPGTPCSPLDPEKTVVLPEEVCRGMGVETVVVDPVADPRETVRLLYESLQAGGVHVVIMRRACAQYEKKAGSAGRRKAMVVVEKCRGEECGCDRFCSRIIACPGNRFDQETGRAYVDPDYCNGCGLCVELCPSGALVLADPHTLKEGR